MTSTKYSSASSKKDCGLAHHAFSRRNLALAVVAIVILLSSGIVRAGAQHHHSLDMEDFMMKMHQSMKTMDDAMEQAPMTGNVDHDFAAMMIPHHIGAIDMAKAELLYGKDPQMRRMAQEILVDQQSEIDLMKRWLAEPRKEKQ